MAATALIVLAAVTPAVAQGAESALCSRFGGGDFAAVALRQVTLGENLYFIKAEDEDTTCPANTENCLGKSYLVPGDQVLVMGMVNEFACTAFVDAKGAVTTGFLPKSRLEESPPDRLAAADDWEGTWKSEPLATLKLMPGKRGAYAILGDAVWASSKESMEQGSVNTGELRGEAAPVDGVISFAMSQNGQVEAAEAGEFDCAIWMRRLGPYLLVKDNLNCGGHNVTFSGVYRRKGK
ncbi:MAG: hypothetical protein HXY22_10190 [Alphaproteobacteria bacterium]|nr:hypothetical protein [Alphaproteobacteria bacterium]